MKIIVDTCIWSLALRRNSVEDNPYIEELRNLIEEIHVQFIGPIRQELLNGIKSKKQFETLKLHLRAFADIELESKVPIVNHIFLLFPVIGMVSLSLQKVRIYPLQMRIMSNILIPFL